MSGIAITVEFAALVVAARMASLERDAERRERKRAVVERQLVALKSERAGLDTATSAPDELMRRLAPIDSHADALTLIIDLAFTNPFAPYEIEWSRWHFEVALKEVARAIGLSNRHVDEVFATTQDVRRAHRKLNWNRIALFAGGGLAAGALGGWLAAPLVGAWLGAAAGFAGAAATSHGLALVGGGTLAAGGLGMAGGMWMVAGAGAALGLVGASGVPLLTELGAHTARAELIKLEVTFAMVLMGSNAQIAKAQEVVDGLRRRQHHLEVLLEQERTLNDENSARLGRLEEMLDMTRDAIAWTDAKLAGRTS